MNCFVRPPLFIEPQDIHRVLEEHLLYVNM